MKASRVIALVCVTAVLAGGGGFMAGRASQKQAEQPAATQETVAATASSTESVPEPAGSIAESAAAASVQEAEQTAGDSTASGLPDTGDGTAPASPGTERDAGEGEDPAAPAPGGKTEEVSPAPAKPGTEGETSPAPSEPGTETEKQAAPEYSITVSTDYGDLYFPDQWEAYIRIDQNTEGGLLVVSFTADIRGRLIPLFEARIGGTDRIGTLTGPDGTVRNVDFVSFDAEEIQGLTEDEQNRVNAMSEDINYVIEHLR